MSPRRGQPHASLDIRVPLSRPRQDLAQLVCRELLHEPIEADVCLRLWFPRWHPVALCQNRSQSRRACAVRPGETLSISFLICPVLIHDPPAVYS
jgi:hypothetical protein